MYSTGYRLLKRDAEVEKHQSKQDNTFDTLKVKVFPSVLTFVRNLMWSAQNNNTCKLICLAVNIHKSLATCCINFTVISCIFNKVYFTYFPVKPTALKTVTIKLSQS